MKLKKFASLVLLGLSLLCSITVWAVDTQSAIASGSGASAFNAHGNININGVELIGSKIAVTQAYLAPAFNTFNPSWNQDGAQRRDDFYDSAFLCIEVTNISSQPLLVTAIKLEVSNAKNFKWGPGQWGGCPSGKVSGVTAACYLQPAERRKWVVPSGFVIKGLVDYVRTETDEFLFEELTPARTNNDFVVNRFNQFLKATVGSKATLKLTLFERDYRPLLVGSFRIAEGKDMFATEPSQSAKRKSSLAMYPLQHDAFLGQAIMQIKSAQAKNIQNACDENKSAKTKNK